MADLILVLNYRNKYIDSNMISERAPAIVIDNGSSMIKSGLTGQD